MVNSPPFHRIECPGVLFSIGHGHAAQGDGEVCGTAIETPLVVSVRLTVRRGDEYRHVTSPCLLIQAEQRAVRQMIAYLEHNKGLTREEAYMLCSVAVDIRVTQVVDMPHYTVRAFLPLDIFVQ